MRCDACRDCMAAQEAKLEELREDLALSAMAAEHDQAEIAGLRDIAIGYRTRALDAEAENARLRAEVHGLAQHLALEHSDESTYAALKAENTHLRVLLYRITAPTMSEAEEEDRAAARVEGLKTIEKYDPTKEPFA